MDKSKEIKNNFLFSIIVPVYNTEKYLEKCLKSIKDAIDLDCEVIIVNDGSTDNSEKIILNFIDTLPSNYKSNFIYTKKENKGLSDTKNVGISMARGDYISVIDSDDYISNNFYKIAREYIPNYDLIIYDIHVVFEKEKKFNYIARSYDETKDNLTLGLLCGAMQGSSCNKIIKKELYNNYEFPIGVEYEDVSVTPFLLYDAKSPKYLPYPLYNYLQRKGSIVASNTYTDAFYKICTNISDRISIKKNFEKYKYIINEFFICRMLDHLYSDCFMNKRKFNNRLLEFYDNNIDILNYIINSNLIFTLENNYTERQKKIVATVCNSILNKNFKKISHLFLLRRIARYFKNVLNAFIIFILTLIGRKR